MLYLFLLLSTLCFHSGTATDATTSSTAAISSTTTTPEKKPNQVIAHFIKQGEYTEALQKATNETDKAEKAKQISKLKINQTKSDHPQKRSRHNHMLAQLVALERKAKKDPDAQEKYRELSKILYPSDDDSWFSSLDKHGPGLAASAYFGIDTIMNQQQQEELTQGYTGNTPHQVWKRAGTGEDQGIPSLMDGVGHAIGLTTAATPLLSDIPGIDLKKVGIKNDHTKESKLLGGAHLATRLGYLLYRWVMNHRSQITPQEAKLLAYQNRRFGVSEHIQKMRKAASLRTNIRAAFRIFGQGLIPLLLLGKQEAALITANTAGIIESLFSIYDQYQQQNDIDTLRNELAKTEQHLMSTPPTNKELQEDANAAQEGQLFGMPPLLDDLSI